MKPEIVEIYKRLDGLIHENNNLFQAFVNSVEASHLQPEPPQMSSEEVSKKLLESLTLLADFFNQYQQTDEKALAQIENPWKRLLNIYILLITTASCLYNKIDQNTAEKLRKNLEDILIPINAKYFVILYRTAIKEGYDKNKLIIFVDKIIWGIAQHATFKENPVLKEFSIDDLENFLENFFTNLESLDSISKALVIYQALSSHEFNSEKIETLKEKLWNSISDSIKNLDLDKISDGEDQLCAFLQMWDEYLFLFRGRFSEIETIRKELIKCKDCLEDLLGQIIDKNNSSQDQESIYKPPFSAELIKQLLNLFHKSHEKRVALDVSKKEYEISRELLRELLKNIKEKNNEKPLYSFDPTETYSFEKSLFKKRPDKPAIKKPRIFMVNSFIADNFPPEVGKALEEKMKIAADNKKISFSLTQREEAVTKPDIIKALKKFFPSELTEFLYDRASLSRNLGQPLPSEHYIISYKLITLLAKHISILSKAMAYLLKQAFLKRHAIIFSLDSTSQQNEATDSKHPHISTQTIFPDPTIYAIKEVITSSRQEMKNSHTLVIRFNSHLNESTKEALKTLQGSENSVTYVTLSNSENFDEQEPEEANNNMKIISKNIKPLTEEVDKVAQSIINNFLTCPTDGKVLLIFSVSANNEDEVEFIKQLIDKLIQHYSNANVLVILQKGTNLEIMPVCFEALVEKLQLKETTENDDVPMRNNPFTVDSKASELVATLAAIATSNPNFRPSSSSSNSTSGPLTRRKRQQIETAAATQQPPKRMKAAADSLVSLFNSGQRQSNTVAENEGDFSRPTNGMQPGSDSE